MSDTKNDIIDITPEQARQLLWERGNLEFKLDPNQLEMVRNFHNNESKTTVWSCSRRLGKSYTLCVLAIETCLKNKNSIVKFLSPTQKMIRTIIRPLMRELVADAPDNIRPIEKVADGIWFFPSTNSQIQIAGCDGGRAETVRGTNADLCIIDEAGFVSKDLEYIVNSILLPLTTTTKGKIILASTPPKSPVHEFVVFMQKAMSENSFIKKTIFDNPRLTKADIDELARAAGGYDSVNFRREYLAQVIKDDNYSIVPEFDDVKDKIIKEWVRPPFFDSYVAMDIGVKDLTVVLFAYFDFRANKLIVEDELVINGQKLTTQALADGIRHKEASNFTDSITGEQRETYKRVADNNNLILVQDLYRLHGLYFQVTKKDDADAALNNMRILIKDQNIVINPKCKTLIRHLDAGVWNNAKTSFSRSGDNGHFDAIDSLKYLVRNVEFRKNPFPANYGSLYGPDVHWRYGKPQNKQQDNWLRIINNKKN